MSEQSPPYGGKYPDEKPWGLEPHFSRWMQELTERGIDKKSDLARELAKQSQEIERLQVKAEIVDLIDQIRADEAWSVEIHADNADFNGLPNCLVIVSGFWPGALDGTDPTLWPRQFRAVTVVECLRAALAAKKEAEANG